MKTISKINILMLSLLLMLAGCTQNEFDAPNVDPWGGVELTATTTIKEVLDKFNKSSEIYSAYKIEAEDSLIIKGIITSTDEGGNVYKYITVQEEFEGGRAIRISVDVPGIASIYHLGRRVSIYLNGLYVGNYGRVPQIGVYGERLQDKRVQPTPMPYSEAEKHIFPYGKPDLNAVVSDTLTIAQLRNDYTKAATNYRLITIKNARFTGMGANYNLPSAISDADKIFAPGTNGVGFPQSREIQDGSGSSVFISTSEYSKFADYPIPADTIAGDITAIVVWYSTDKSEPDQNPKSGEIYYQLTLRTLNDLGDGFEPYHDYLNERKTANGNGK